MDGRGRTIRSASNAEVKGSKPASAHPNRGITSLTASTNEGPRTNYSLSRAAPPVPGRGPNGLSSSTAARGVPSSKPSSQAGPGNGKRPTAPMEDRVKGICRSEAIHLLEMSYRKGVSVDAAGLRIGSGGRQNISGAESGRRDLFAAASTKKPLHPVQGSRDPAAKPAGEFEVRRSSLGGLANSVERAKAAPGASRRPGKPACPRNERGVAGSHPTAEQIKRGISDFDMEIVAGSVADAVEAVVVSADMPSIMQIHAFRWARRLCDSDEGGHLAFALKKEFDRNYGPAWHCIVGRSFGSFVTHSAGGFLCFSIQNISILLFRTHIEPLEPHREAKRDMAKRRIPTTFWEILQEPCETKLNFLGQIQTLRRPAFIRSFVQARKVSSSNPWLDYFLARGLAPIHF